MISKKNPEVDLHRFKGLIFSTCLVLILLTINAAFEWRFYGMEGSIRLNSQEQQELQKLEEQRSRRIRLRNSLEDHQNSIERGALVLDSGQLLKPSDEVLMQVHLDWQEQDSHSDTLSSAQAHSQ